MEILKFGKFKGQNFDTTPIWYQNWLLKQDWYKKPIEQDSLILAQKRFSNAANRLRGWDGYSRRGWAIENEMFEAEKAIEDAIFDDPNSDYYRGEY
jgi:hypothetical protein